MGAPDAVLRRLIDDGFSGGRLDVADEVIDPAMVEHQDYGPGHAEGAEGVKAVIAVAGDVAWSRNVATGTNDGSFMGHPPTGRTMRIDVIDVVRVRNGRIAEHWGVPDRLGVLQQLGLAG